MANNMTLRDLVEPLYERQSGESAQSWHAFQTYRDLGSHRSLFDAYRQVRAESSPNANLIRTVSGQWTHWATVWQWTDRAQAWDAHLDVVARQTQEDATRAATLELAESRRIERARELEIGNRLLQRAEEMLALPVIEVTTERDTATGRVTQTIKPAKWRLADAAAIARIGVELKRLGLDMETSRTAVRVDIEDEVRRLARDNGWDEESSVALAQRFAEEAGA